jgi:hypothetical protein
MEPLATATGKCWRFDALENDMAVEAGKAILLGCHAILPVLSWYWHKHGMLNLAGAICVPVFLNFFFACASFCCVWLGLHVAVWMVVIAVWMVLIACMLSLAAIGLPFGVAIGSVQAVWMLASAIKRVGFKHFQHVVHRVTRSESVVLQPSGRNWVGFVQQLARSCWKFVKMIIEFVFNVLIIQLANQLVGPLALYLGFGTQVRGVTKFAKIVLLRWWAFCCGELAVRAGRRAAIVATAAAADKAGVPAAAMAAAARATDPLVCLDALFNRDIQQWPAGPAKAALKRQMYNVIVAEAMHGRPSVRAGLRNNQQHRRHLQ